jgi:hypothetical protein
MIRCSEASWIVKQENKTDDVFLSLGYVKSHIK